MPRPASTAANASVSASSVVASVVMFGGDFE
jgi:hypothetical protein